MDLIRHQSGGEIKKREKHDSREEESGWPHKFSPTTSSGN
jgi:hypothetical protein